ncbi:MAG: hypothetical protein ACKOXB_07805, partial [Flavobacteriales bacterium]
MLSTSYYNLSGQLIATAIAGATPTNLDSLKSNYNKVTLDTADLSPLNEYSAIEKSNGINYDFFNPLEQDVVFKYTVSRQWYESNCAESQSAGSACSYLLEVVITDAQDVKIPLTISGEGTSYAIEKSLGASSFTGDEYELTFTAHMKVGQYKI